MHISSSAKIAIAVGSAAVGVAVAGMRPHRPAVASESHQPHSVTTPADPLAFHELFEPGAELKVSRKAAALAGHRVRLIGHMAQMELAPTGGFFLTARPLRCDEAGGGTADLPPDSVLVIAHAAEGKSVPFIKGPLEVSGTFEVGNVADPSGRVSAFRIRLDAESPLPESKVSSADTSGPT